VVQHDVGGAAYSCIIPGKLFVGVQQAAEACFAYNKDGFRKVLNKASSGGLSQACAARCGAGLAPAGRI
jgi:hypothetical protein